MKTGIVCITGDVHHMSLKTSDQKFLPGTEVDAMAEYVDILDQYNLKGTFFITGRTIKEESGKLKQLIKHNNIEFGGHNYFAFRPIFIYSIGPVMLPYCANFDRTYAKDISLYLN